MENGETILEGLRADCAAIRGDRYERLAARAGLLKAQASQQLPRALLLFVSGVASGMASWNQLNLLAAGLPEGRGRRFGQLA